MFEPACGSLRPLHEGQPVGRENPFEAFQGGEDDGQGLTEVMGKGSDKSRF